ncbi:MAG: BlaI/MecI/CopY family transcriptional regulator [Ahniella sp.]|nr:BlaI/MecI/CopY family transcriptional regulator [Ahniella sp.]
MDLLWIDAPQTSEALITQLSEARGWQPSTVKTLLSRLVAKGAVRADREGRRFLYWPLWERSQCVSQATRHFLESWFGGQLTPLVAHLSQHRTLRPSERKALAKLLRDLEGTHDA